MAVEIYIWLPKGQGFGHAAMKVTGGVPAGDVYMSRWPGYSSEALFTGPGASHRYEADVAEEGGPPRVVRLTKLDETAVKKAIAELKTKNEYNFWTLNCCSQVKECLDAGIRHGTLFSWGIIATTGGLVSYQAGNSPWGLLKYAQLVHATFG
jgi:hypothetical protein